MAEHSFSRAVNAYVLVKTEPGAQQDIAKRLREQIEDANVVAVNGAYDIVLSIEADGEEYVTTTVRNKVLTAHGVQAVETLMWVDDDQLEPVRGRQVQSPDEPERPRDRV
jgi:hypothetical protein